MKICLLANHYNYYTPYVFDLLSKDNQVTEYNMLPPASELSQYDLGVSWFYRHILKQPHIDAVKYGILNCHIGLLPDGRGSAPNVWSIVHDFPAGVTIHYIDSGIDTGPVVARKEVVKLATDTGETLYKRLVHEMWLLFEKNLSFIQKNYQELPDIAIKQTDLRGRDRNIYRTFDLESCDDLEKTFGKHLAHQVVDVLRARTFPGHESAFIRDDEGKKVYVRVSLGYEK